MLHNRLFGATIVIAIAIGLAPVVRTQSQAPIFRAAASVVLLQVSVTSAAGQPVDDLTEADFTILEDGEPQPIAHFLRSREPLAVSLMLDTSASMDESLPLAQRAALEFTARLKPADVAEVVAFNDQVRVLQPFTGNPQALGAAIRQTSVSGTTALYAALYRGLGALDAVRVDDRQFRRRAIVLLSDGEDTSSAIGFDEVFDAARRSNVAIYPIGLGIRPKLDHRTVNEAPAILRRFADATGGRAVFVDRANQLSKVYRQVADELESQYTLAYSPKPSSRDGRWHTLGVRVACGKCEARTREGYFAEQ